MSGITITVDFSAEEITSRLTDMIERMDRPLGFYEAVGEYMTQEAVPRSFATETAPDGTPWASLSSVTVARREKKGQTPIMILRSNDKTSQNLHATIRYQADESGVSVGSHLEYAAVQQLGAAQGAFGRTKRNGAIPWGAIPPRPFLGLSEADEKEILNIAADWLGFD